MSKYKLFKVTIEKEFVVAAPAGTFPVQVEATADDIMSIHADSMRDEHSTFVLAEEIKDIGELPEGWHPSCLPYYNSRAQDIPADLVNKSVKEILEDGAN